LALQDLPLPGFNTKKTCKLIVHRFTPGQTHENYPPTICFKYFIS